MKRHTEAGVSGAVARGQKVLVHFRYVSVYQYSLKNLQKDFKKLENDSDFIMGNEPYERVMYFNEKNNPK